jgi:uncharacterized protein YprB with RNaseH-like and TPR domain
LPRTPDTSQLLEIPGATIEAIEGKRFLEIERNAGGLMGVDVGDELHSALRRLNTSDPESVDRGIRPAMGWGLSDLVVLDLETTGLWGCPIFLVGLLLVEKGRLVTQQLVARDYPEEEAILLDASRRLAKRSVLVTMNGKSYDVPCFRDRAVLHRVSHRMSAMSHVDILHPARRRWASDLPNCRLKTLERFMLGIHRTGDVPSSEIPSVYHRFTATGDVGLLRPVLHHSRVDLLTTAMLLTRLASEGGREVPVGKTSTPRGKPLSSIASWEVL